MTGRVLFIGNIETIPSKSGGEPFKKRLVVLNCTRMDFGKTFENYPSFEFSGRHVDDPTNFKVDDIVTISFALQGTKYKKDNQPEKFFNTVAGYKIELYQRGKVQQQNSMQADAYAARDVSLTTPKAPTSVDGGEPPVCTGNDDLPF